MKIIYCKKWSVFRKQPHDIITEQEAKRRHEKNEPYTAVIYNSKDDTVRFVVDVNSRFIVVNFFNEELENYLMYGLKIRLVLLHYCSFPWWECYIIKI